MKNYQTAFKLFGGYSLITAGLVSSIALCFHPDEFIPDSVLLSSWRSVHLLLLFAFTISIFVVVSLLNTFTEKPNAFGVNAFALGFIGCAWRAAIVMLEVFVLPSCTQAEGDIASWKENNEPDYFRNSI